MLKFIRRVMGMLSGSLSGSDGGIRKDSGDFRSGGSGKRDSYRKTFRKYCAGDDVPPGKKRRAALTDFRSFPKSTGRSKKGTKAEPYSGSRNPEAFGDCSEFIRRELASADFGRGNPVPPQGPRQWGHEERNPGTGDPFSGGGKRGHPFRDGFSGSAMGELFRDDLDAGDYTARKHGRIPDPSPVSPFSETSPAAEFPGTEEPFQALDDYLAGTGNGFTGLADMADREGERENTVSEPGFSGNPEFAGEYASEFSGRLDLRPREDWFRNLSSLVGESREHLPLTPGEFSEKVLPLIENALDYMDALPASECYHHCEAGGLFRHSLETAVLTLSFLKRDVMTLGDEPEKRRRKAVLYALAVYTGGLLHDAGKAASDMEILTGSGDVWIPVKESLRGFLCRHRAGSYFFRYRPKRGKTHENLTPLLAREIIPPPLLAVLMSEPAVYSELFDALYGNTGSAFYSIIKKADTGSVEADLRGTGAAMHRFARKPHALIRLIAALQNRIRESPVPFNTPGSYLWYIDEILYLVMTPDRFWELVRFGSDMGISLNLRDYRDFAEKLVLLGIAKSFSEASGEVLTPLVVNDGGRARLLFGLEIICPEYFCQNLVPPCSIPGAAPEVRDLLLALKREDSSRDCTMEELLAMLQKNEASAPDAAKAASVDLSAVSSPAVSEISGGENREAGKEGEMPEDKRESPETSSERSRNYETGFRDSLSGKSLPESDSAGDEVREPELRAGNPFRTEALCLSGLASDVQVRNPETGAGNPIRDCLSFLDSESREAEMPGDSLYEAVHSVYSGRKKRSAERKNPVQGNVLPGMKGPPAGKETVPGKNETLRSGIRPEASCSAAVSEFLPARNPAPDPVPASASENTAREQPVPGIPEKAPEKEAASGRTNITASGKKAPVTPAKKTAASPKKAKAVSGKSSRKKKSAEEPEDPGNSCDASLVPVTETCGACAGSGTGDDDWALNPLREKRTPPRPRNASGRFIKMSEAKAAMAKSDGNGARYFV